MQLALATAADTRQIQPVPLEPARREACIPAACSAPRQPVAHQDACRPSPHGAAGGPMRSAPGSSTASACAQIRSRANSLGAQPAIASSSTAAARSRVERRRRIRMRCAKRSPSRQRCRGLAMLRRSNGAGGESHEQDWHRQLLRGFPHRAGDPSRHGAHGDRRRGRPLSGDDRLPLLAALLGPVRKVERPAGGAVRGPAHLPPRVRPDRPGHLAQRGGQSRLRGRPLPGSGLSRRHAAWRARR